MSFDIYQAITDRIIEELENGTIPWTKPWIAKGGCIKHANGQAYSMLNQMLLGKPGEWLTYKQAQDEGGQVRKGEKGRMVVFWKPIDKTDDKGQPVLDLYGKPEKIFILRYYTVFHIDQCDGIKPKWDKELPKHAEPDSEAEEIVTSYVAREHITLVKESGDAAYYQPESDRVVLPLIEQFKDVAEYYSTAFHELVHSTGRSTRLNRIARTAFFGNSEYSKEELCAEMGASMLVNHVGLETSASFHNSAAYIQSWLKVLKGDKRFIVSASSAAEKAVNFILGKKDKED